MQSIERVHRAFRTKFLPKQLMCVLNIIAFRRIHEKFDMLRFSLTAMGNKRIKNYYTQEVQRVKILVWRSTCTCMPASSNLYQAFCRSTSIKLWIDLSNYLPRDCPMLSVPGFQVWDRMISLNTGHHWPHYSPNLSPLDISFWA